MRIAAIIYIILSIVANFLVDHIIVFLLATLSFPLLLVLLLRKQNKKRPAKPVLAQDSVHRHDDEFSPS